jgi:hypothetical protein
VCVCVCGKYEVKQHQLATSRCVVREREREMSRAATQAVSIKSS